MKFVAWGAFMMSVAALAAGCGGGSSTGGAGGAGGAGGGDSTTTTSNSTTTVSATSSGSTTTTTTTASSVSSTSSGVMNCGTFVFDSNKDCQACMTEQCCMELAACDGDCSALFDCVGKCAANDMTCTNKCIMAHQAGLKPAQSLANCFKNSCQSDARCKAQQFPICDSGLVFSDPSLEACATCLGNKCCAQFKACAADTDKSCLGCLNNPMTAGCDMDMLAKDASSCIATNCAMECN